MPQITEKTQKATCRLQATRRKTSLFYNSFVYIFSVITDGVLKIRHTPRSMYRVRPHTVPPCAERHVQVHRRAGTSRFSRFLFLFCPALWPQRTDIRPCYTPRNRCMSALPSHSISNSLSHRRISSFCSPFCFPKEDYSKSAASLFGRRLAPRDTIRLSDG